MKKKLPLPAPADNLWCSLAKSPNRSMNLLGLERSAVTSVGCSKSQATWQGFQEQSRAEELMVQGSIVTVHTWWTITSLFPAFTPQFRNRFKSPVPA